jgi:adenylylsulfate kinase
MRTFWFLLVPEQDRHLVQINKKGTMDNVSRTAKEERLRQRARVIWLFGISAAGKSTLATGLELRLHSRGFATHQLDGDNLRAGLNRGLGFGDADRTENLRRVAEVARLFVQAGIVTICSFITPLRAHRAMAREIIGAGDLLLFHVAASYEECARRDPKGLYARAAAGELPQFTGRDSTFEEPQPGEGAVRIQTEGVTPEVSLAELHGHVLPWVRLSEKLKSEIRNQKSEI